MFTLAARLALGVALLGIWLSASAAPSYACDCPSPGSPSEALAQSHSVFRGVVTSISMVEREDGSWGSDDPVAVEISASEVWKGPTSRTRTLETVRSEVSCGFEFELGAEYIVYTHDDSFVSLCSRTHSLATGFFDDDYNDLEELGQGQAPTDAIPAPTAAAENQASGGCGRAMSSGADVWWAALAVSVAWLGKRRFSVRHRSGFPLSRE